MLKLDCKLFLLVPLSVILVTYQQKTETQDQCYLIQKKDIIHIPFVVPSFLKNANKTYCQETRGLVRHKGLMAVNVDHPEIKLGMLRCGNTYIYIKPECVCSFYNVFEASLYHGYSSCPAGAESDIVTQLKCPDCKKFSLNINGPSINGGKLSCKEEEVTPKMKCQCPLNYLGAFCEIKVENITRICSRVSYNTSFELENCNSTWNECVTYSRNNQNAYRCQEVNSSQNTRVFERRSYSPHDMTILCMTFLTTIIPPLYWTGFPFCLDIEYTTQETITLDPDQNEPEEINTPWAGTCYFMIYLVLVLLSFISFLLIVEYSEYKSCLLKTYTD